MLMQLRSVRRLADEISVHQNGTTQPSNEFMYLISFFGCSNPSLSLPLLHLSQGNITFSCVEPVYVAATFTGPKSFLSLPGPTEPPLMGTSIRLQFRTWNEAGLLLTFNLPMHSGAVWMYLSNTRLHLQVRKAGRAPLELSAGLWIGIFTPRLRVTSECRRVLLWVSVFHLCGLRCSSE